MRGYTLFTQERGDEAAAKLAAKFANIAREIVETRGGTLLELRPPSMDGRKSPTTRSIGR